MDLDLRAIESNDAGIGRMRAGDDLYERRFSRAIVARERHHFGRIDLEIHLGERFDSAEMFRYPLQFQDRNGSGRGAAPTLHRFIRLG